MDIKEDQWVWVVVHGPEGNEQLLGQQDPESNISFIPCFLGKEEAINGLGHLKKDIQVIHTVQAIIFEDLRRYAAQNNAIIFILTATGEVIEKIAD